MPFDSTPQHPHAAEIAIVGRMQELLATPDRWCQGATAYWKTPDSQPAYCLMGALRIADNRRHSSFELLSSPGASVEGHLQAELRNHIDSWNDAPGRTHAEVLNLLARVRRHFEEAE